MKKLILKRCIKDNEAYSGFKYPPAGHNVEASDWKNTKECGCGLHGWDTDNWEYFNGDLKGNFVVLEVEEKDGYIEMGDKVKFKKGKVIYNSPDFLGAKKIIRERYPDFIFHWDINKQGHSSTNKQGDSSTNKQGDRSTNTQGHSSTNIQGHSSTNTQGDYSTNKQGDSSTNKQGDSSTNKQGHSSTNKQGDRSTNTQGGYSTNKQGDRSTNTQGGFSTNTIFGRDNISKIKSNLHATVMFYENKMKVLQGGVNYFEGETIKIENMKIVKKYTTTMEKIKTLKDWEVFVFGSNLNGNHIGGAAKLAKDKFSAEEGKGEGLTGQCYAFPTLDENMQKLTDERLKKAVDNLINTANKNTKNIFLLTKVGCGIAGYEEDYIKEFFNRKDIPANIILPKGW